MRNSRQVLAPDFITDFPQDILAWYGEHGRDLPWRRTRHPYAVHVSEIMLQQTQVSRVVPKYEIFLERFPDVISLAGASLGEVLRLWSGLGYNRRAKYLWHAARIITEQRSEEVLRLPKDVPTTRVVRHNGYARFDACEKLRKLPGIGRYTASAIAVFAYNHDEVLLETNTRRIYQLLFLGDSPDEGEMGELAERLLPRGKSRHWHHALMDLGSLSAKQGNVEDQQQFLVGLFPILSELGLPRFPAGRVTRPRQSRFEGSRREIRGRVVRRLTASPASQTELEAVVSGDRRLATVLDELHAEGFIARSGSSFQLSE